MAKKSEKPGMVVIYARIPVAIRARIDRESVKQSRTPSYLIRRAILEAYGDRETCEACQGAGLVSSGSDEPDNPEFICEICRGRGTVAVEPKEA
jgi:hypothetical protein